MCSSTLCSVCYLDSQSRVFSQAQTLIPSWEPADSNLGLCGILKFFILFFQFEKKAYIPIGDYF